MNASAWAVSYSPGGGIQHQQHLGDLRLFLDHATIFVELIHEPALGLEAAVSTQHDVDAPSAARAPRSGTLQTPDPVPAAGALDGCAAALCPGGELLNRRRPEGVCGADDHCRP
jgi:hypothetical protein